MLNNGAYFEQYPEKVLGEIYDTTNRYGQAVQAVRGNLSNLEAIQVPTVRRYEHFVEGQFALSDKVMALAIEKTLAELQSVKTTKPVLQNSPSTTANLISLGESIKTYNPGISELAIKVWVTYQVNRGLFKKEVILGNDWKAYYVQDSGFLASLVGKEVAFDGQDYVPSVLYYSGNIYQKIAYLEANREAFDTAIGKRKTTAQLKQLNAALPAPLVLTKEASNKLSLSPFDKLFTYFKVRSLGDGTSFESPVSLVTIFRDWYLRSLDNNDFLANRLKTSAYDIKYHWLQRRRFPRGLSDNEKAARKRAAQVIGSALFDQFLMESLTAEDKARLEHFWNEKHNNYVDPNWHQIPVGFSINRRFKGGELAIRPAQREGVGFLNINGTGIIAYDVGVGKTLTSLLYLADMMDKGLCNRPLIVVPNQTYQKWIGEINGVYAKRDVLNENGKVLFKKGELMAEGVLPQYGINDLYNLGKSYLQKVKSEDGETIALKAGTITIVTYEGLMKIGFAQSSEGALTRSIKAILSQGETGRDHALIEEKIATLVDKSLVKSEVFIEKLGIDAILVDEAHNFKNLFTQVRGEAKISTHGDVSRATNHYEIQSKNPSARAIKLFMLNRYIQLKHNRRNTIGLTATPFTNSPLEIYSMQALFDYDGLKAHGIENIVDYFNSFIDESYEAVWTARGQFEQRAVIRGFHNLPTMQSIIFKYILYKTGEEANILRPHKVVLPLKNDEKGMLLPTQYQANTEIPATAEQEYWFKEIANFARNKVSELDSFYQENGAGRIAGRDLIAINAAQLATFSPYLLPWLESDGSDISKEEFIASSPKLRYVMECIRSVKDYHAQRNESVSGQVIYANRGTAFFPHIKAFLVEYLDYKASEVQIIIGSTPLKKKEQIKKDFLDGNVKIVIGSATIREGIDLQRYATVLYNCFLDWNPTDIQQLEGRIWRFGNVYSNVRIVIPLIENSFDIFLNQKLGEKTSRVNTIWKRNSRNTVLKLEDLNPDELKKGLITDPIELVKITIEEETQELSIQKELFAGYITQLMEAQAVKLEVDANWQRLQATAKLAHPKKAIPTTPKGIYQKVKAYAKDQDWNTQYDLNRLVELHQQKLKQLKRIEQNILAKNDLDIHDNFEVLIEDYQNKLVKIKAELIRIQSANYQVKLLNQFIYEKEAKQLQSKTLEERVNEFSRLNFLLECKDANFDGIDDAGNVCDIYGIQRGEASPPQPIIMKPVKKIAIKKPVKKETTPETPTYKMSQLLKNLMPKHQQVIVRDWPEELKQDVLGNLEKQAKAIPKRQDKKRDELTVYAHLFYGSSDWFITEYDGKDLLFGYTILNGDSMMSELGTIWLPELRDSGLVELDFYWEVKSLPQALHNSDPDYFKKPKDKEADAKAQAQRIRILKLKHKLKQA